ncbi:hypothetical protein Pla108_26680 [Botrimarina colliarenosi]|uniref:Uncharacterized protein n=1 Tax=Botrimarina colliarenosi TaxID=2528001 RepID=A0A5C6AF97_9BACT|nr:hypothetical protein [Botrimarina colliarenosi]TWT96893.1 hypothetical protein Pla108_26680 [Botrimarina colliarenosi]
MSPSGYDRPHDRWLCGLESQGDPCSVGPTCAGRCPRLAECAPIRAGDRWVCNRSPGRGGECESGPTPDGACCLVKTCRPKPSLRRVRRRWLRGAAVFAAGALLMLLGAGMRNELAAPGELSSHHAQVIARADWSNRCAACHPGANEGPTAWVAAAWSSAAHDGATQSGLCVKCHQDLAANGREPLLAHGLPTEALPQAAKPSALFSEAGLVSGMALGAPAHGRSMADPLACAACHQEHHGAGHDLTAITDTRCQACHSERYTRFADDHPDFGSWPIARRTRIAFNHASHSGQHYLKASRSFDCRSCHLEDSTGDLTMRPDYHQSCAECHDADIGKSFGDGLAFLALPTIDPAAVDAGEWPEQGKGDFDGELPAFTKLLLAADPAAHQAMQTLGADFSFFDVESEDAEQLAAAKTVIDSLKRLLSDLQEEGHGAIAYRLRTLLGHKVKAEADYVGRLPIELVDRIQGTWLGAAAPPEEFDAVEDRRTGGGWSVDDQQLTLRYRPTGHDDELVRAWLDAIVALPDQYTALREACLAEFRRPGAPGACFDCHSIDQTPAGFAVNWRGRERLDEPRGFTRFSHRPHLVQPELADCTHCHRIDATADPSRAYAGFDPARPASEFAALSTAACASCHKPHAAGDSCTQCHNYHVETPLRVRP